MVATEVEMEKCRQALGFVAAGRRRKLGSVAAGRRRKIEEHFGGRRVGTVAETESGLDPGRAVGAWAAFHLFGRHRYGRQQSAVFGRFKEPEPARAGDGAPRLGGGDGLAIGAPSRGDHEELGEGVGPHLRLVVVELLLRRLG